MSKKRSSVYLLLRTCQYWVLSIYSAHDRAPGVKLLLNIKIYQFTHGSIQSKPSSYAAGSLPMSHRSFNIINIINNVNIIKANKQLVKKKSVLLFNY